MIAMQMTHPTRGATNTADAPLASATTKIAAHTTKNGILKRLFGSSLSSRLPPVDYRAWGLDRAPAMLILLLIVVDIASGPL